MIDVARVVARILRDARHPDRAGPQLRADRHADLARRRHRQRGDGAQVLAEPEPDRQALPRHDATTAGRWKSSACRPTTRSAPSARASTPYIHYRRGAAADSGEDDRRPDARRRRRAARAPCGANSPRSSRTSSSSTTRRWTRRWRRRCCRPRPARSSVSAVGIVAMVLASIGLYGVIAYSVARRTREIGIRMALGAQPAAVVGLVMKQGLALAAVGVGVGALLALGAAKAVAGALYGVSFVDPIAWGARDRHALPRLDAGEPGAGAPRVGRRPVGRAASRVTTLRAASRSAALQGCIRPRGQPEGCATLPQSDLDQSYARTRAVSALPAVQATPRRRRVSPHRASRVRWSGDGRLACVAGRRQDVSRSEPSRRAGSITNNRAERDVAAVWRNTAGVVALPEDAAPSCADAATTLTAARRKGRRAARGFSGPSATGREARRLAAVAPADIAAPAMCEMGSRSSHPWRRPRSALPAARRRRRASDGFGEVRVNHEDAAGHAPGPIVPAFLP